MQPIYWFVAEVNPRNAGYRVRTLPIVTELRAQGMEVEVRGIAQMTALVPEVIEKALAVFVSKPSDTATHLCLRHFGAHGVPVVVDLFDNYFSWSAALAKRHLQWQWMRGLQTASVVVSSSPYLRHVIASLTDKPVVQVGDEVPPLPAGFGESAAFISKWTDQGTLDLLWFGISGNPYYAAGLEDLARWGGMLRTLSDLLPERTLRLTICTNRVPAVDAVLADLRAHQVEARFVEWTEEGCNALLEAAHVVLLPTNLSGFSLGKTHNRCSDALLRGCLVLSSPRGPYVGVGGAVIDDPRSLVTVLRHASAEGVRQLIVQSFDRLRGRHDLRHDVTRLKSAVLAARADKARRPAAGETSVLVTARVKAEVPKFSRVLGFLVAGFADHALTLNYDFCLQPLAASGDLATVALSDRAWKVVETILARNVAADMTDHEDRIECRIEGWHISLMRSPRALVVLDGLPDPLLRRLARAQQQGRGTSLAQAAEWHEPHVDTITRILWHIGLRKVELATEDEGGWEAYADNADPVLAAINGRLVANWIRHDGNEVAWGRPAGATA